MRNASDRRTRRRPDWLRFAPFFAALCAAFALLKSAQYHSHGQLSSEQSATFTFVLLSLICLAATLARLPRYLRDGRTASATLLVFTVAVLAFDAMAVWNLSTAMVGGKDQIFR